MSRVETSVRDYASRNPDADYSEIAARFGSPQQIASSYVDEMGTVELLQNLRIRRNIERIVAIIAAMAVVLWLGAVTFAYLYNTDVTNGYYEIAIAEETMVPIE